MAQAYHQKIQISGLFLGKILAMVATFIMPVVLTRVLSKGDYGIYSQYYVYLNFITGFFCLGLHSNLYYYLPLADLQTKKKVIWQTFAMLMLIALITSIIISIPVISKLFISKDIFAYKNQIILGVFLIIPIGIIEPLYVLMGDIKTSVFYPPFVVVSKVLAILGFLIAGKSLMNVFSGFLWATLFVFLFVLRYVLKEVSPNGLKIPGFDKSLLKQQLTYSLPLGIAASINSLTSQFDKLVCISFLTPFQYASYSVAFFGIPAIQQIYDSFTQVYLVEMSKNYQSGNKGEVLKIIRRLISKTYSYTIPSILIFSLYAKRIIVLVFTDKYEDSTPLFRIYLISFLFVMMGSGLVLRAAGSTKVTFKAYMYSSFITLPSTFLLVKYYGIMGAITGSLLSVIIPKLYILYQEIQILGTSLKNFIPIIDISKTVAISVAILCPFIWAEFYFKTPFIIAGILGGLYLILVFIIEIRLDMFVLSRSEVMGVITKHLKRTQE